LRHQVEDGDADGVASTTATGGAITGENLTLWREGRIPTRSGDRGYNGLFLGWYGTQQRQPAVYSISLPQDSARWQLTSHSTVELSIAALDLDAPLPLGVTRDRTKAEADRPAPDFTIELVTRDGTTLGVPASRFGEIAPPLRETFTKFKILERDTYGQDWEPVFQTIRVPLAAFTSAGTPEFDPQKVVALRLRFDRTGSSVICISGIGFGSD
jgi:hypothetical protein